VPFSTPERYGLAALLPIDSRLTEVLLIEVIFRGRLSHCPRNLQLRLTPPRTVRSGATLEPAKRQFRPIRSCAFRKPSEGTRLLAPTSGTARPVGGLGKEARSSQAAQPRSSGLDRVHQIPPVYRASGDLARVNFSRRFSHSSELKNLGPTSIRRGIMLNTAIRLHGRPSRMRNPFSFRSLTIAE
jgi:hypothetical protein